MSDVLTIKHGANFRGGISFFGMLMMLAGLLLLFFKFNLDTLNGVIGTIANAGIVALGANIFLGFEGVQFDLHGKRVREYYSLMGLRIGVWQPISDYERLMLAIDRFTVPSSTPFTPQRSTLKHTFDVTLVMPGKDSGMLLFECKSYEEGRIKLEELAVKLDFPIHDKCLEDMEQSKKRREDRGRRR